MSTRHCRAGHGLILRATSRCPPPTSHPNLHISRDELTLCVRPGPKPALQRHVLSGRSQWHVRRGARPSGVCCCCSNRGSHVCSNLNMPVPQWRALVASVFRSPRRFARRLAARCLGWTCRRSLLASCRHCRRSPRPLIIHSGRLEPLTFFAVHPRG